MSIHKALSELAPNANWCMDGAQTYGNIQWNSNDITCLLYTSDAADE